MNIFYGSRCKFGVIMSEKYSFQEKFKPKDPSEFNFKEIIFEKNYDTWTATVTINRPEVYNAY